MNLSSIQLYELTEITQKSVQNSTPVEVPPPLKRSRPSLDMPNKASGSKKDKIGLDEKSSSGSSLDTNLNNPKSDSDSKSESGYLSSNSGAGSKAKKKQGKKRKSRSKKHKSKSKETTEPVPESLDDEVVVKGGVLAETRAVILELDHEDKKAKKKKKSKNGPKDKPEAEDSKTGVKSVPTKIRLMET
ncbi:hypothetical protein FRC11_011312 [Ceratobasidium sp. 423]|nr:hypothetical protein FRC11_011312 [Ceratobasidium sp. 423]